MRVYRKLYKVPSVSASEQREPQEYEARIRVDRG
jgi:hypothetical protein